MARYEVPVMSKKALAPGVTEISLDISRTDFRFKAGQYATITLPLTTNQPMASQFHDFSITSSPHDHAQLKVAFHNSASFFKTTLLNLPLGAPVILEGPSGAFMLTDRIERPVIAIAGGIGVTPFLSMLADISETNKKYDITLFYANRDSMSAAYTAELRRLSDLIPSLRVVFTMTNDAQWSGENGVVESELIGKYIKDDLSRYDFYIAGPPAMVFAVQDDLRRAGVPDGSIRTEGFTGLEIEQVLTGSDYNALISSLDKTALVSMTDAKGHIIYANPKFVEISKYSLHELLGQNHRLLKSGHQPDELFDELWETISAGRVWRGEIKNKAKDGSYYWVDTSISPVMGVDNRPERYISVRFLISERKEKEDMLSGLLSALDQTALVSMTDSKGAITYANQKFVEISKYALYELIGQNHRLLKSNLQSSSLFVALWDTISHGQVWRGEIMNKAKDGTYYWVDTSIAPVMGAAGRPEKYISVRFLVTDKKEREQSLLRTKVMDDAILASMSDGVIATDQVGKILLVNPAAAHLLGWEPHEMAEKLIEDVLAIKDKNGAVVPLEDRPYRQIIATKKPFFMSSEFSFVKNGDQVLPVTISAAPLVLNGTIIGVIQVFNEKKPQVKP